MSGTVWFTSDTHFDHKLVAQLRGFETPAEHDAEVVRRWNTCVRSHDVVWHLGDVGMGSVARWRETLAQLNGTIHLVAGNHDAVSATHRDGYRHLRDWYEMFETVSQFARRRINGHTVLLSHYPYQGAGEGQRDLTERHTQFRLPDLGDWLLHGHTHSGHVTDSEWPRQVHVGLDAWSLRPVSINEVAELIK